MQRSSSQRGAGKVGVVISILVLLLVVSAVVQLVPVKIKSSTLYDHIVQQAERSGRAEPAKIKATIVKKAEELDLPVTADAVTVKKEKGRIHIRCTYTVPVNIVGFTFDWKFDHDVDRQIFVI